MVIFENIAFERLYSKSLDKYLFSVNVNRIWSINYIKSISISHISRRNYSIFPLPRNQQRKYKINMGIHNPNTIHLLSPLSTMVFRVESTS